MAILWFWVAFFCLNLKKRDVLFRMGSFINPSRNFLILFGVDYIQEFLFLPFQCRLKAFQNES